METKANPYLLRRSLEIILAHQSPAGSFPAAPDFPVYRYAWLRDGAFTAYALDLAGENRAAARFYHWVKDVLTHYCGKARELFTRKGRGENPAGDDYLHTRFRLCGQEGEESWGNFQLDGYGAYLWGINQHQCLGGRHVWAESRDVMDLVAAYLVNFWDARCLDCWEENDNHLHPSTLAAIYGGLTAYSAGYHRQGLACPGQEEIEAVLTRLHEVVARDFVRNGHFTKHPDSDAVDANLLWLAVPFGLYAATEPRMTATVRKIERDLAVPGGGIKRYAWDTYYGGGPWILLTAWLGWYYTLVGNSARAVELLAWVEGQADASGNLPEQVPVWLNSPDDYHRWVDRWGPIANPLLWSHAMYLVLAHALGHTVGHHDPKT